MPRGPVNLNPSVYVQLHDNPIEDQQGPVPAIPSVHPAVARDGRPLTPEDEADMIDAPASPMERRERDSGSPHQHDRPMELADLQPVSDPEGNLYYLGVVVRPVVYVFHI